MIETCPNCGHVLDPESILREPPIGTWAKDRHGHSVGKRHANGNWAPPGCIPLAKWEAMWKARGPLTICGPWGVDLDLQVDGC